MSWFDEQIKTRIQNDQESFDNAFLRLSSVVMGQSVLAAALKGEREKAQNAIEEILDLALTSFRDGDLTMAIRVEPLEQVVDKLIAKIKAHHITRLQRGECTIELGFILSDLMNNYERISDHCSNIAVCIIESAHGSLEMHEYLNQLKASDQTDFKDMYERYKAKYALHS